MTAEIIDLPTGRYGQHGYHALLDLPQRGSIEKQAFGAGWWELDQIFKFYLGQFVVVSGISSHGKSTFMLNVLTKLAREKGVRSFLYVPENEAYLLEKLSKIWGDDETFEYFAATQCFVQSSVPDDRHDEPHTLDWVLDKAETAVVKDSVEIVVIDPWNELDRAKPKDMLLTDYIAESLRIVKQFCRTLNAIVVIVAHPTKSVCEDGGRVPNLSDIADSIHWFNKCDNGLVVFRDPQRPDQSLVISQKVREIGAGKVGACHFTVDPETGRFEPQHGAVYEGEKHDMGRDSGSRFKDR